MLGGDASRSGVPRTRAELDDALARALARLLVAAWRAHRAREAQAPPAKLPRPARSAGATHTRSAA